MPGVVVTDKALREMVREAMWNKEFAGWSSNSEGPAAVNAEVDPSIAVTDPVNPNFSPQSRTEFGVAVNQLVKNLPDDQMPGLFDVVKTTIEEKDENEKEEDMDVKAAQGGTRQVEEETVRRAVRKILSDLNPRLNEALPSMPSGSTWLDTFKPRKKGKDPGSVSGELPPVTKVPSGEHGGEYSRRIEKNKADLRKGLGKAVAAYEAPPTDADMGVQEPHLPDDEEAGEATGEETAAGPETPKRRGAYKSTALGAMGEEGMSFQDIAAEIGKELQAEAEAELAAAEESGDQDKIAAAKGMKTTAAVSGAKRIVDQAIEKAKFLTMMDPDDLEIIILDAMNDFIKKMEKTPNQKVMQDMAQALYIRELEGSGELTFADVQLMQDHPNVVKDLDGYKEYETEFMKSPIDHLKNTPGAADAMREQPDFREFLHNVIQRNRRTGQKVINVARDGDAQTGKEAVGEAILYLKPRGR